MEESFILWRKIINDYFILPVCFITSRYSYFCRADSTDDKIAAQDNKIADLSSEEQSVTQAQVDQIQAQVSEIKKQQGNS